MKKIIFTIVWVGFCYIAIAQGVTSDTTTCDFRKNIKFKKGIDTVELTVFYRSYAMAGEESLLRILADKKQISLNEYLDENSDGNAFEFILPNCSKRFVAALSRKIYDRTYVMHNIQDYQQVKIDLDNLKEGQKVYLKCIVFEEKKVRSKYGDYFFTIINLQTL